MNSEYSMLTTFDMHVVYKFSKRPRTAVTYYAIFLIVYKIFVLWL